MIDKHSETWKTVSGLVEQRLKSCRSEIEQEGTGPDRAQFLRGRILELNQILSLTEELPVIADTPTNY